RRESAMPWNRLPADRIGDPEGQDGSAGRVGAIARWGRQRKLSRALHRGFRGDPRRRAQCQGPVRRARLRSAGRPAGPVLSRAPLPGRARHQDQDDRKMILWSFVALVFLLASRYWGLSLLEGRFSHATIQEIGHVIMVAVVVAATLFIDGLIRHFYWHRYL